MYIDATNTNHNLIVNVNFYTHLSVLLLTQAPPMLTVIPPFHVTYDSDTTNVNFIMFIPTFSFYCRLLSHTPPMLT